MQPEVVISAQDSDVIKTYVELGLGLLADMSYNRERDAGLVSLSAEHLFEANTVWLGVKRGQLQRKYACRFIQLCNPQLTLTKIEEAVFATAAPAAALDYQI